MNQVSNTGIDNSEINKQNFKVEKSIFFFIKMMMILELLPDSVIVVNCQFKILRRQ